MKVLNIIVILSIILVFSSCAKEHQAVSWLEKALIKDAGKIGKSIEILKSTSKEITGRWDKYSTYNVIIKYKLEDEYILIDADIQEMAGSTYLDPEYFFLRREYKHLDRK